MTFANDQQAIQHYYGVGVVPGWDYNPPQEYGVDVAAPSGYAVHPVESGYYEAALSSPYQVVLRTLNGIYEQFIHVTSPGFKDQQLVTPSDIVGTVSPLDNSNSNLTFTHGDNSVITYHSGGPHFELQFDANAQSAEWAGGSGAINPLGVLNSVPTPNSSNNNPIQNGANAVGSTVGGIFSGIGTIASNINNSPSAINSPIHLGDWFTSLLGGNTNSGTDNNGPDPFGIQHAFTNFGKQLQALSLIFIVIIIAVALIGAGAALEK